MFYNAPPIIFERANLLRKNMTAAETKLWKHLKGKRTLKLRFRAQHPIYKFIADFYCHSLKLVIEVDGDINKSNEQKEYDIGREAELDRWEIKVIRFKNEEIENGLEKVIQQIRNICAHRSLRL
jgi:very-short-patch-repair endonuclease